MKKTIDKEYAKQIAEFEEDVNKIGAAWRDYYKKKKKKIELEFRTYALNSKYGKGGDGLIRFKFLK